ncbi:Hypothetical protein CINCED_3A011612, partial [Cinara cedri]
MNKRHRRWMNLDSVTVRDTYSIRIRTRQPEAIHRYETVQKLVGNSRDATANDDRVPNRFRQSQQCYRGGNKRSDLPCTRAVASPFARVHRIIATYRHFKPLPPFIFSTSYADDRGIMLATTAGRSHVTDTSFQRVPICSLVNCSTWQIEVVQHHHRQQMADLLKRAYLIVEVTVSSFVSNVLEWTVRKQDHKGSTKMISSRPIANRRLCTYLLNVV